MTIQLNQVNFSYGTNQVLSDIDLHIEKGKTTVLLGPSGAGKSTLLRTLNLLEIPKSGSLSISGQHFDFHHQPDMQTIRTLRKKVGMVFQQYHLWQHMSVQDNLIEAPMKILKLSRQQAVENAENLLHRLKLSSFAHRFPLQLSGGQQQRVAIARALMMQPDILLFDEPTAALDPEITTQIVEIINELQSTGITQVVVTHEVAVARKVANQVVYMEQGRIVEQGDKRCFIAPKTPEFAHYLSHSDSI